MADIIEAKRAFNRRTALTWLLILNGAVFVALRLVAAFNAFGVAEGWLDISVAALSLPASVHALPGAPWSLLTYMFSQYDVSHLLFNMLWLAWFGMFMQNDFGNRPLLLSYFSGGIAGGMAYLLWGAFAPEASAVSAGLIGSSAAVISVALAVAVAEPSRPVYVVFIGHVKLKWVAALMVAIALIWFSGHHPGSDMAHAGGAVAGIVAGLLCRRIRYASERASARRVPASEICAAGALTDSQLLDSLLDKIRCSGYDSLSVEERATLFSLSQRLKKEQS